jgi:hypothetical protein
VKIGILVRQALGLRVPGDWSERRLQADRRQRERRVWQRRVADLGPPAGVEERRSGVERRVGVDRRTGRDRRDD